MGISRRKALAAGISYGTGCLHFGNDSIVYNRELKKLPNDTTYRDLRKAIEDENLEAAKPLAQQMEKLCSSMALSEAYMACRPIVEALDEDSLPAIDELDELEARWRPIVDYIESCFPQTYAKSA